VNVIMKLLQSRKNLQIGAGASAGGLIYLIPLFVQLLGGDKVQTTIQHTSDVMALAAVLLGVILAALTAIEDCARKFGVTVPPEAEGVNTKIKEMEDRLKQMAEFVRAQVPDKVPDSRTPVKE
jgi:hypothetical protein